MNAPLTRIRTSPGKTEDKPAAATTAGAVGAKSSKLERLAGRNARLTLSVGGHRLSPIQYQSFEVAPLELSIDIQEGDDVGDISRDAFEMLRQIQETDFKAALAQHRKLVLEAEKSVK